MSFRSRQLPTSAWEKLYEKREKEISGQIVQNPQECIKQMYDKLVKPQLARRGAHVPLPFEKDAEGGSGEAKASSKNKQDRKKDKKTKDKEAKRKKKLVKKKLKKEKKVKKKKKKKESSSSSSASSSSSSSEGERQHLAALEQLHEQLRSGGSGSDVVAVEA